MKKILSILSAICVCFTAIFSGFTVSAAESSAVPTDGMYLIGAKQTKFIAHRGVHINGATENSITAFKNAGERTFWGIETDVHVTKDGKFIICHDDTTGRTGSPDLKIEESNYDDVRKVILNDGTTIPSLEEYLQICRQYDKVGVLELKNRMTKEDIGRIVEIVEQEYSLDKMVFISFSWDNMTDLRDISQEAKAQYLSNGAPDIENLKKYNIGFDVNYTVLKDPDVIKNCQDNNIEINAWTVDSKPYAKRYIDKGIEYITTNTLQPVVYGDANSDGKVTAVDTLIIRQKIAGQTVTLNSDAGDVNIDTKLTAADVLLIRKFIAGQPIVLGK